MPQLYDALDPQVPRHLRTRIAHSELRMELEAIEDGQVLRYGPDEPAHIHRDPAPSSRNQFHCAIQEMVARVNRTPAPQKTYRLASIHDGEGNIFISTQRIGRIHGTEQFTESSS